MKEVFSRQVWLLNNLGVGGGKRWRFLTVQALVWTNCISLLPAVVGDRPLAVRCLILACALVSAGSGFKLVQLRRHANLLQTLLEELGHEEGHTPFLDTARKVSKIYVSLILGLLCAWLAYPWLLGELELLLDYWSPVAIDQDFIYFTIQYTFASLGLVLVAHTQEAVDTLVLLIAALICRKLAGIRSRLGELGAINWDRHHTPKRDHQLLRSALDEHIHVIRLIRIFDKLISDIFLVQVLQTTVVSTISYFSASKIGELSEVPKFLTIVSATYMQFFIYCWLGEEISSHSTGLHRGLYESQWYNCHINVRKAMNRFETFTKWDFKLKGGRVFAIHLETFLVMVRESFSAFLVMRAVAK